MSLAVEHIEMGRKRTSRIITVAGIAVIGALVAFMVFLQVENAKAQDFANAYGAVVADSRSLTQAYQAEVKKWNETQYDNAKMASVTDEYLPKFQQLVDRAEGLQPVDKFKDAQDLLVKSLDSERQSYVHFRNYLISGDAQEDKKSNELLSQSLQYEAESFAAFKAAGG
jgi:hypothetical protein